MRNWRTSDRLRAQVGQVFITIMMSLLFGMGLTACAREPDPYLQPDESWITLSGTVDSVKPDSFNLDYGDGTIRVEMDDGDRDSDAYRLVRGDKVMVSGRIDDAFFESTKIEAASVFVENLGTIFFASSLDEDDWQIAESGFLPAIPHSKMLISGVVTKVNRSDFLIDTGDRTLRVDTSEMPFDPLDDEGYLKIDSGDRVRVLGQIDVNLFEGRRLIADTLVEIRKG